MPWQLAGGGADPGSATALLVQPVLAARPHATCSAGGPFPA